MHIAYLDNSATTRVYNSVAEKAIEAMTSVYGNPASLHRFGMEADELVRDARSQVAARLACQPDEIYFTSGGTESNNIALLGGANARRHSGNKIITTSVEHPSVLNCAGELEKRGFNVVYLPVDSNGKISVSDLEREIDNDTILVSIMLVNNETGAIQPVTAAGEIIRRKKSPALLHCDMVQGFGKLPATVKTLGADMLSLSGHKIHAPKGIGALYVRKGLHISPVVFGGGQEKGLRSGTVPVPNVAALGEAAREIPDTVTALLEITGLRNMAVAGITALSGTVINSPDDALPYIINFSVPGIPSEVMIHFLESQNVFVSGGSACSKGARSHVLTAQGLSSAVIDSAIRVSLSADTSENDILQFIAALNEAHKNLRRKK